MKALCVLAVALIAAMTARPACAADTIKIGVIYPLTGNAASAGSSAKDAIELGAEIANGAHPSLKGSSLAGAAGLMRLGGARIELVNADQQGNPSVGQSQTRRLVTQEKVAAMLGAYHSSVALTATAVAERYGMPFLVADSVALNITQRGFKWIFRTGPIAPDFANAYTAFLTGLKPGGRAIERIAVVNENTDYGTSVAASILDAARKVGINVAAQIPYNANSSDVSGQVLQLKELKPDAVIFISYTSDTILYMKTLKNLDYLPPMIIGDDAGFSDPAFIPTVGDIAQGVMNRSAFDVGSPGSNSYKVNELFKVKFGRDLDDTSARWMQGFLVLVDAINRAGSTEPAKIQTALQETDLKPDALMIGYSGVKCDATGQNPYSPPHLRQVPAKDYKSVWPVPRATSKLDWPMKGWRK